MGFQINIGRSLRKDATFNLVAAGQELPVQTLDKGSKVGGGCLMGFAVFWIAIPVIMIVVSLASGEGGWFLVIPALFVLVGLGLFVGGLAELKKVVYWDFSEQGVSCRKTGLFGEKEWSEPLGAYRGVLSKSVYHSGGKNSPSYTEYIVTLEHSSDKKRTVKLYSSRLQEGFRKEQERCARLFGLSALVETDQGVVERDVDDLDKSVRERVSEGAMKVEFDPSVPPPGGRLVVRPQGRELKISTAGSAMPRGVETFLLFLEAAAIACVVIGLTGAFGAPTALAAFAAIGAVVLPIILIASRVVRAELSVSPETVRKRFVTPWGSFAEQEVAAGDIEEVVVGKPMSGQGSPVVRIVTDDQTIELGAGLKVEEKKWIRDCIIAVISAPSAST